VHRLRRLEYYEPTTLAAAVEILGSGTGQVRVLAGGTDLIVDLKTARLQATGLVNLKRIPGMIGIVSSEDGIEIGALATATEIARSELVARAAPGLSDAASHLASPPVRALATIGGNVCRASPASDLGPALIGHNATALVTGIGGDRRELVEDLYLGPGETTLAPGDVITGFRLAPPPPRFGSAHVKLGKRESGTDIAIAGVAASVTLSAGGEIADCRIVLASLGPTPLRAKSAEAVLRGVVPTDTALEAAGEAAATLAKPIDDVRAAASYRTRLARVLTRRALRRAIAAAAGEATE
jgi:CO/xanthine dehydrogenase FAD-binding subunit